MRFQLKELPYRYDALEPFISEETMRLHHTKHQQAYVDGANKHAHDPTSEDYMFNAGGVVNHDTFWQVMTPNQRSRDYTLFRDQVVYHMGSFRGFLRQFSDAAASVKGAGWAMLLFDRETGGLTIRTFANQDTPAWRFYPLLVLDVWEHAYYLTYQNRRKEYIKAFWNVVNWSEVSRRFEKAARDFMSEVTF